MRITRASRRSGSETEGPNMNDQEQEERDLDEDESPDLPPDLFSEDDEDSEGDDLFNENEDDDLDSETIREDEGLSDAEKIDSLDAEYLQVIHQTEALAEQAQDLEILINDLVNENQATPSDQQELLDVIQILNNIHRNSSNGSKTLDGWRRSMNLRNLPPNEIDKLKRTLIYEKDELIGCQRTLAHTKNRFDQLSQRITEITRRQLDDLDNTADADTTSTSEPLAPLPPLDVNSPDTINAESNAEAEPADTEEETDDKSPGFFRKAAHRYLSKFLGHAQPEDGKSIGELSAAEKGLKAAEISADIAATVFGVKAAYATTGWFAQKIGSSMDRRRIRKALEEAEKDQDESTFGDADAIAKKVNSIKEQIENTPRLSPENKKKLLDQMTAIIDQVDVDLRKLRQDRDEQIKKLLEEAITTRVSSQVAFKEALNSALHVTGFAALRGTAYGAVSMYERHKKVTSELREGYSKKEYFNKYVTEGLQTTFKKMSGGDADTWMGKAGNMALGTLEAMAPVLRAAGFVDLAMDGNEVERLQQIASDLMDRHAPEAINNVLETSSTEATQPPTPEAAATDTGAPEDTAVTQEEPSESPPAPLAETESSTEETSPEASIDLSENPEDATSNPEVDGSTSSTQEINETTTSPEVGTPESGEVYEGQKELALTKKGDGIVNVLIRQLEGNPQAFGFDGDAGNSAAVETWARNSALDMARADGLIRAGGDTRLTTEAIERLSVMAQIDSDGNLEIKYFDNGEAISEEEFRNPTRGLSYEHGSEPVQAVSNEAKVENTTQPEMKEPEAEVRTAEEDDVADQPAPPRPNTADTLTQPPRPSVATAAAEAEQGRIIRDDEGHIKKFKSEHGKVRFFYDDYGNVEDASMNARTIRRRHVIEALKNYNITREQVVEAFLGDNEGPSDGTYTASNRYDDTTQYDREYDPSRQTGLDDASKMRTFERRLVRLERQKAILTDMAASGYGSTQEYQQLLKETKALQDRVDKVVKAVKAETT